MKISSILVEWLGVHAIGCALKSETVFLEKVIAIKQMIKPKCPVPRVLLFTILIIFKLLIS